MIIKMYNAIHFSPHRTGKTTLVSGVINLQCAYPPSYSKYLNNKIIFNSVILFHDHSKNATFLHIRLAIRDYWQSYFEERIIRNYPYPHLGYYAKYRIAMPIAHTSEASELTAKTDCTEFTWTERTKKKWCRNRPTSMELSIIRNKKQLHSKINVNNINTLEIFILRS